MIPWAEHIDSDSLWYRTLWQGTVCQSMTPDLEAVGLIDIRFRAFPGLAGHIDDTAATFWGHVWNDFPTAFKLGGQIDIQGLIARLHRCV